MGSPECKASKDFIRHIVNRVISDNINRIPATVIDDVKNRFGRAEDKYRFTIYGGDPRRLLDYFNSDDWKDTVKFIVGYNLEWLVRLILESLISEYRESCAPVAEKARELLGEIERLRGEKEGARITPEYVYRKLSNAGYKVRINDNVVEVEESLVTLSIEVSGNTLNYKMCKTGSSKSLEGILLKLEKLREI